MNHIQSIFRKMLYPQAFFSSIHYSFQTRFYLPDYETLLSQQANYPFNFEANTKHNGRHIFEQNIELWWVPYQALKYKLYQVDQLKLEKSFFRGKETTYQPDQARANSVVPFQPWISKAEPSSSEARFFENRVNFEATQFLLSSEVLNPRHFIMTHRLDYIGETKVADRAALEFRATPLEGIDATDLPSPPQDIFWFLGDYYRLSFDREAGVLLKYEAVHKKSVFATGSVNNLNINEVFATKLFVHNFTTPLT